jgi:membrane protein
VSPTASPWRLGGLSPRELARRVWNEIGEDETMDRAAALSYYFMFALFPTLLFLTALLGLLSSPSLIDTLIAYLGQVMPSDAYSMFTKTLAEVLRGARSSLVSVGALAALWAASAGMDSIMTALTTAYDAYDPRPWWKRRLVSIGLTLVFATFTLTALVFLVVGPQLAETLADFVGLGAIFTTVWTVVRLPVALFLVLVGVGLVYYLAPPIRQRWYWVTPGSAVAVLGWVGASAGLRAYVAQFTNYNATYGSIGGVILLLLWLYLTGLMLLIGAEVNAEIAKAARAAAVVPAPAISGCAECRRFAEALAQADHRQLPAMLRQWEQHLERNRRQPAA